MAHVGPPPRSAPIGMARRVYSTVGFTKGYNFVLWLIFLGAFFLFTLARLQYLDFHGVFCSSTVRSSYNHAAPGECFYLLQQPYKLGILLHLAGTLPAALLVCLQFIPVIRHKFPKLHAIVGYIVIILSIMSVAGIWIILPRSFGGGLDVQVFIALSSTAFLWALFKAMSSIKYRRIGQHRAWMLRAWFWAGCIVTGRIIHIVGLKASLFAFPDYIMPCDKIDSMLGDRTLNLYPQCASFYSGENLGQSVAVCPEFNHFTSRVEVAAALDSSFGTAYLIALLLHVVGLEIYLRLTTSKTRCLRVVSSDR
ncbi:hypothetical protein F4803DRAFT_547783 [Xylaria telfairii]|nr:hypothetical protein F4803DRAFT_547783 [Xylaria telfairii]